MAGENQTELNKLLLNHGFLCVVRSNSLSFDFLKEVSDNVEHAPGNVENEGEVRNEERDNQEHGESGIRVVDIKAQEHRENEIVEENLIAFVLSVERVGLVNLNRQAVPEQD